MLSKAEIEQNKIDFLEYQDIMLSMSKGMARNKYYWNFIYPIVFSFFTNLIKQRLRLKKPAPDAIYDDAMDTCIYLLDKYNRCPGWKMNDLTSMGYWIWVSTTQNKKRVKADMPILECDLMFDNWDGEGDDLSKIEAIYALTELEGTKKQRSNK